MTELRELTTRVVNDARRAADVITRIRAMATRRTPEQALLSVDEIIREALTFLRHEIQSHGLMVTHYPNPVAPKVFADRMQLQQVIVNLTGGERNPCIGAGGIATAHACDSDRFIRSRDPMLHS